MEHVSQDEIEDLSLSPPTVGSMQIAGSNGFGHNIEFMSQAYLRNRSSEIDIEVEHDTSIAHIDQPLPIFLKFENVEYKVKINQAFSNNPVKVVVSKVASQFEHDNYKHILKGITGSINPGEILALMGPSGSGKTTLLKILGGRLHENVKGTVTYNDIPYNPALKRRVGFVTQDDVLFPQLTVEETLVFAALLRLPSKMSRRQKYERAEVIIKELGLERCRHTRIGGGLVKGVSGGERKRASIGHEILVDPSLLLLDEPTSGLDSTSANRLLQVLQGLAKMGKTIITTIHQPSSRIFHMFEKILLIAEGYPVYYGKARESMEYFSSLGFIPEIAMNPAEFLLDLATGQVNDIRVPDDLYPPQCTTEREKIVIRIGLMFYICIFWTSSSIFGAVYVFPFEKMYLVKERKADMYRLSVYYICSTLCDMVAHVVYPTFFMCMVYFMAGFKRTVQCFFLTLGATLLIAITSQGAGELFGAAVMSVRRAGMVASLILMLFLLTGGYYVQLLRRSLGVQILSRVYRQGFLRVQLVSLLCFERPNHLDRQRAFRAFGFGNARHGQSPDSGRDKLGIKARFMVPGCLRNRVGQSLIYGCVERHTYKQEATRRLGMSLFLPVLIRAIESECSSFVL
ncbi:ABC transporter G family member 26 [Capsicum annuum]|uniref:ABC transporter G family member 26 n=1 Tax=Capsicum annuum TaxID=4072 RepID=A0A2G2Z5Z0_CAPAN|nr:ABC transporter G family member 26 [Capsicum annuum]